jgi:hypothetical protein
MSPIVTKIVGPTIAEVVMSDMILLSEDVAPKLYMIARFYIDFLYNVAVCC